MTLPLRFEEPLAAAHQVCRYPDVTRGNLQVDVSVGAALS